MPSVVVSGISFGFPRLSRCEGQIAHVLLTRSPLVYPRKGLTARLACVKHAASVRPEPGSNSPTKTGPTNAPRTGPRRLNVQTGTKPVHEQARHTVEFSRDTRTPFRSLRIGPGQLSYGTWSWARSQAPPGPLLQASTEVLGLPGRPP